MAKSEKPVSEMIGKKAPAFTLPDQDGRKVKPADWAGRWVVLYFYPKDDTPGCTVEACDFTFNSPAFAKLGGVVVGVSPDSPATHTKFIAKHGLKIALLSDEDHGMMLKYGAWGMKMNYGREYEGVIRSTLIIDPAGKVAHHWPNVKAAGHAARVLQKLNELIASRSA